MSKRNDITNWFKERLESVTSGNHIFMNRSFISVTRDPIDTVVLNKMNLGDLVAGVYDVDEETEYLSTGEQKKLRIVLEVYTRPTALKDTKSELLNEILSELQMLFRKVNCDGLAYWVHEVNNSIDIDGVFDRTISCSITFEVSYRINYC